MNKTHNRCRIASLVLALASATAGAQTPPPASALPTNPLTAGAPQVPQVLPPGQYPGQATVQAPMANPYNTAPTQAPPAYQQPVYQQPVYQQPAYQAQVTDPPQAPPTELPPLPSDFDTAVQRNLGMTPEQIRMLRSMLDDRQRAASEMPNPPKSVTGSVSVSMSPGSSPPVVRPFYGVSTSLVVLDSTGAPWPVENFSVGNRQLYTVERLDGPGGSTFTISPTQQYGQSNMILKLAGAPTPVVVNLVSGQNVHDARVEARVQGRGPNASVSSASIVPGVDSRLLSVLDGVPPEGRSINVGGDANSKAWLMPSGRVWLRTHLTVVSPAPIAFVSAADGTRVYELMPAAKVLGMQGDQFVTIDLNGCLQECSNMSTIQEW